VNREDEEDEEVEDEVVSVAGGVWSSLPSCTRHIPCDGGSLCVVVLLSLLLLCQGRIYRQ